MGQVSRGELATLIGERGLSETLAKTPRGKPPRPATRSVSAAFHRLLAEIGHRLDEAGDIVPVRR